MSLQRWRWLGWLVISLLAADIQADDARPLAIDITELAASELHHYKVQWRIPPLIKPHNYPAVVLPANCSAIGQPVTGTKSAAKNAGVAWPTQAVGQALYRCGQALTGELIAIRYPQTIPALTSVVVFTSQRGERHTQLLSPGVGHWLIPKAETVSSVAYDYTLLGIQHIWAGLDHLLFVMCLLWIAGTGRRMLITITGFTLAHSVTLILSSLQWIRVPVPPVEAAIALSIVFLALEITRQQTHSLTWRYPVTVSSSFGLLHGFGFAAALSDIGLPQTELLTGLLFFNVGVEIGQVLFAGAIIVLMIIAKRWAGQWLNGTRQQSQVRLACSYSVGSVAAYWWLERCVGFV